MATAKLTGPVSRAAGAPAAPTTGAVPTPFTGDDTVTSLPGIGTITGTQYAGYASIYGDANPQPAGAPDVGMFYWFVGAPNYPDAPTILWTNGGPGSSSFWGFFTENGPYQFDAAGNVQVNPNGWNNRVNYLIFEHPLTVTLSFVPEAAQAAIPTSVEMGIAQYHQALLNFLIRHPQVAAQPLVLAGESYAGTYLPLLAQRIRATNGAGGSPVISLRGMVLLDAWVNPPLQMAQDTTYAFNHGMISADQKLNLDLEYKDQPDQVDDAIAQICGLYMANIAEQGDPPFEPVLAYLNRADVRAAIHVTDLTPLTQSWSTQISNNYAAHVNDSYAAVVEELLQQQLPVVVMSGLNDAKDCNFLGTGAWLAALTGPAADAFRYSPTTQWTVPGPAGTPTVLGYIQSAIDPSCSQWLCWVKVLNAGHLAVRDQPRILDLIQEMLLT